MTTSLKPLIKWPGGKSSEIPKISHLIPKFDRYIEPFFGGGALYYYLSPRKAAINDISKSLMQFYSLISKQDAELHKYLIDFDLCLDGLSAFLNENSGLLLSIYYEYQKDLNDLNLEEKVKNLTKSLVASLHNEKFFDVISAEQDFTRELQKACVDKIKRTVKNDAKKPFSSEDLCSNLNTGIFSGFYMYCRDLHNTIELGRKKALSQAYATAVFVFVREYCYGSMFRYNKTGEFNIPYGGMSYNDKRLKGKIQRMFNGDIKDLFSSSQIYCCDFETFLDECKLTSKDFVFLDPPYDTNFSEYDGNSFTREDQTRLADYLARTEANFLLIIKNTDYIFNLYNRPEFAISSFGNTYAYNVRSRNKRDVEHLIVTNHGIR